jgi:predicted PurR-regulated permease PerM
MIEKKPSETRSTLAEQTSRPARALPITWWWLVSALAVALFLALGGLILFRDLARVLMLLVLGVSIANALAPLINWFDERVHLPRTPAIVLIYIFVVLIIASIVWLTVPVVIAQVKGLAAEVDKWMPQITGWLTKLGLDTNGLLGSVSSVASSVGGLLISLPAKIFSSLFDFVLVLFISLYWLFLMNGIRKFFLSFFPQSDRPRIELILIEIGNSMGGYLRGAAIDGAIFGVSKFIVLTILGVPYALTLGILAGVLEFFPVIGAIIAGTLAILVALSVSPTLALITLIAVIVLQQLENHILVPLVMRSQTSTSPLLAVLAIVAGGTVGGILGAIVGIPIVSVLDVLTRLVIAPAIRKANGVEGRTEEEGT